MPAFAPFTNRLIVDVRRWLGQEPGAAIRDSELLSCPRRVFRPSSAPKIDLCALRMQLAQRRDDGWHRQAFATEVADQGVVDVYVDHLHGDA